MVTGHRADRRQNLNFYLIVYNTSSLLTLKRFFFLTRKQTKKSKPDQSLNSLPPVSLLTQFLFVAPPFYKMY